MAFDEVHEIKELYAAFDEADTGGGASTFSTMKMTDALGLVPIEKRSRPTLSEQYDLDRLVYSSFPPRSNSEAMRRPWPASTAPGLEKPVTEAKAAHQPLRSSIMPDQEFTTFAPGNAEHGSRQQVRPQSPVAQMSTSSHLSQPIIVAQHPQISVRALQAAERVPSSPPTSVPAPTISPLVGEILHAAQSGWDANPPKNPIRRNAWVKTDSDKWERIVWEECGEARALRIWVNEDWQLKENWTHALMWSLAVEVRMMRATGHYIVIQLQDQTATAEFVRRHNGGSFRFASANSSVAKMDMEVVVINEHFDVVSGSNQRRETHPVQWG